MHRRWPIVMVDEFQDTDPVQWQVIDRAFSGRSTVILIGDPKQAIYAFRGGDIVTYLHAAETAGAKKTLGTNWRSDAPLVDSLQAVLRDAELGDPAIVVHDVEAANQGHRLAGAPHNEPFRLRVVSAGHVRAPRDSEHPDRRPAHTHRQGPRRRHRRAAGQRRHVRRRAAAGRRHRGDRRDAPGRAGCASTRWPPRASRRSTPATPTSSRSEAADDWLCLLEAFDQPHRSGLVRAAATTMFFGHTAEDLAAQGDALTDRVADTLREWADHARERGVAAVFEAAQLSGMGGRVLSWLDGERHMTDLAHLTQVLHDTAHREHFSLPALRDWLRTQREERSGATERNRRLDSDAAAVQIMTVWVSKGLQYPVVYLPFAFNRNIQTRDAGAVPRRRHPLPAHRRRDQPRLLRGRTGWAAARPPATTSGSPMSR